MLQALVIAHYNFENEKGKEINTTKLRVSLKGYGTIDVCSELANEYKIFDEVKVKISYNDNNNKFVIDEVTK